MKNSFAVAAALAAEIGIGSFGVHALHAQSKPPVYMIEDNTVIDPAGFAKEFAPLARESLITYGGQYLGGGSGVSIDGDPPKGRVVLVRWDSVEQMMKWRHSPEYNAPAPSAKGMAVFASSQSMACRSNHATDNCRPASRISSFIGLNDEQPSARRIGPA